MMNRIIRNILTALLVVLVGGGTFAQTSELVNPSYDLKGDSIFFSKMHQRFAQIREEEHRRRVSLLTSSSEPVWVD